ISGGDGDGFVGNRDLQNDAKGYLAFDAQACVDASVAETFSVKVQREVAGCDIVEAKRAGAVRGHLGDRLAVGGEQRHLRLGGRSSRGIEERSANGARRRRKSLVFGETHRSGAGGPV